MEGHEPDLLIANGRLPAMITVLQARETATGGFMSKDRPLLLMVASMPNLRFENQRQGPSL